jgi:hypothetical protein
VTKWPSAPVRMSSFALSGSVTASESTSTSSAENGAAR